MLESIKIQKDHILKGIHSLTVTTDTTTVTTGIRESDVEILLDASLLIDPKNALSILVKKYLEEGYTPAEITGIVNFTINQY